MTLRISKFTYGVLGNTPYRSSNPEHVQRTPASFVDAMGDRRIPGNFQTMLTRVRDIQPLLGILD